MLAVITYGHLHPMAGQVPFQGIKKFDICVSKKDCFWQFRLMDQIRVINENEVVEYDRINDYAN